MAGSYAGPEPPRLDRLAAGRTARSGSASCWTGSRSSSASTTGSPAFDPALVRRVGAIPAEYVYYFYDPGRYVAGSAGPGASRGQDVLRLNERAAGRRSAAFAGGDLHAAWSAYDTADGRAQGHLHAHRHRGRQRPGRGPRAPRGPARAADRLGRAIGGYEGLALRVIDGLSGRQPGEVIVNSPAGASLGLDAGDVVEMPTRVDAAGLTPLAGARAAARRPGPGRAGQGVRARASSRPR